MFNLNIILNTIERVRDFAAAAQNLPCEVDVHSGHYIVDGKSVMSLFALDLSKPLKTTILCDEKNNNEYREILARFAE